MDNLGLLCDFSRFGKGCLEGVEVWDVIGWAGLLQ